MAKRFSRKQLIKLYLKFFEERGHAIIPGSSLIPENDPSVLFTTAGMHPLVPFLLGQPHPQGKCLADVQKCIRTADIDEVGDDSHLTFFEMLGNWSLGDYFKEEAIKMSIEFLTSKKWLGIDLKSLHITVFAGDKDAPRDEESAKIWQSVGISPERIHFLPKAENWWGPAGEFGPCGPCTEMFIDTGKKKCSKNCKPGCFCGKYFEIWNDVFLEYNKTPKGYEKLKQKNVDTGMGVERTIAILQKKPSVYETEVFAPLVEKIKSLCEEKKEGREEQEEQERQVRLIRVIADHLKAAAFILAEKITPSNLDQGYVLRRLIRKSIRYGRLLGINKEFVGEIAKIVVDIYKEDYPELEKNKKFVLEELEKEEERFRKTLEKGLRQFEQIKEQAKKQAKKEITGKDAFLLFSSYGFPIEMTRELAKESKLGVDEEGFKREFEKHQKLSRIGAEKRFKGGLSEKSIKTIKLHTATHLLNQSLRDILGHEVQQRGSNITPERLRFDFNYDKKLTNEQLKEAEQIVNEKIKAALSVKREEMTVEEAKKAGAQAVFAAKYSEIVSVYSIGNYSKEICAGPHVSNTSELGKFKIIKEEAIAAGVRRIKAVLQ